MIVSTNTGMDVDYSSLGSNNKLLTKEESDNNSLISKRKNLENKASRLISDVVREDSYKKADINFKPTTSQNSQIINENENENEEDLYFYGDKDNYSITSSFDALAAAVGSSGGKVTKGQLLAYLQTLMFEDSGSNSKDISFVKNLIAKFDMLSDGTNYISSFDGINEIQDYLTVTKEQVTSPVDLRV
jgi:hypothetical protein